MKMMDRIGFTTLGCPDWDFEQVVRYAGDMGFSAIEMRGIQQELHNPSLACFAPQNIENSLSLLAQKGVTICALDTSASFHQKENIPSAMQEAKENILLATRLGVPYVRVFGDRLPDTALQTEVFSQVAQSIGELCEFSKQHGNVQVLLESHGDFNTPQVFRQVLSALDGVPNFGVLWDIAHSFRDSRENFKEFYSVIQPCLRHIHMKDGWFGKEDMELTLPGKGEVNIAQIVTALEKGGYTGVYSFEWEKRWHPELASPEVAFPAFFSSMQEIAQEYGI